MPPESIRLRYAALLPVMLFSVAGCDGGDTADSIDPGNAGGIPSATRSGYGPFRAIVTFTVDHPDSDAFSYAIACEGDVSQLQGAADIDADAACAALTNDAVQERLIDGPPANRVCTEIYGGPETATVHGNINGAVFETSFDRTDGCGIYEWDDLFGDLLVDARREQGRITDGAR